MKFTDVASNPGGIRSVSFLTHKSYITAFPALATDPATSTADVTYEGNFTMDTDKKFVEIYTRKGSGKAYVTTGGPKDGKYFINKADIDYPDVDDDALALAKAIINSDLVMVVGTRVANSSTFKFVVLGSEMFACEAVTTDGDTGTIDDDGKKFDFKFEAKDINPLPRYIGTIEVDGGTWDCSTGTFTPVV